MADLDEGDTVLTTLNPKPFTRGNIEGAMADLRECVAVLERCADRTDRLRIKLGKAHYSSGCIAYKRGDMTGDDFLDDASPGIGMAPMMIITSFYS